MEIEATKKAKQGEEEKAEPDVQPAPFSKLFCTADRMDWILMIIGSIGAAANGAAWPIFAVIFSKFTDVFGGSSPNFMDQVREIALYFMYLGIGSLVASYLEAGLWMWTGNRQTNRIRQRYLAAVLRQDISFFDTQATTGGLLAGLNEDSINVQNAISEKLGAFIHHTATFVVGFAIAFWRGWDMTLVMVGCLPFLAITGMVLAKLTTTMTAKINTAYAEASSIAQQSISQIRTVAAYHQEEKAAKDFEAGLAVPLQVGLKQSWANGISLGGIQLIVYSTYAVAFAYGADRVAAGKYTGGDVLNVLVAALLGGFSLGQAAPNLQYFAKGRVAGAKLFSVIDRTPAIDPDDESGETIPQETFKGEIVLKDVSFAYPARPDVHVFRSFNLTVPAGKTVALVGSSGSGKSTVVGLIERFYDPAGGCVLLDGVDLRRLSLAWLRAQVGLVSQEPTLFATTIGENIAMGRPGASAAEVQAAARDANAHEFIARLPQGYDTQVGERGTQLSGGQKQRIAIARAILKNPRVLLLDEATSALDTQSERVVQDALDRMIVGRTTVVVAHRLSTIKGADVIAVVRSGQVVEQGSHEQLSADPLGAYTNLVKLQMQASEAEAKEAAAHHVIEEEYDEVMVTGTAVTDPAHRQSVELNRKSIELYRSRRHSLEHESVEITVVKQEAQAAGAAGGDAAEKAGKEEQAYDVPLSRLVMLNKPEWHWGIIGLVSSAAAGVVNPAFALVISSMLKTFYVPDASQIKSDASFYCWMFFVIAVGSLIAITFQQVGFGYMGQYLAQRVRALLFGNMLRQEVGWFDMEENSSGKLNTMLSSDAAYVRGAVGDVVGLMLQNILCLAFGYIIAFVYNWRMALVVTGILPLLISSSIIYHKFVSGFSSGADKLYAKANQTATEAFSSIRVIQAYKLQGTIVSLYGKLMGPADQQMQKQAHYTGIAMGYANCIMFGMYSVVIVFGGYDIEAKRTNFEDMLKSFLAIMMAAMGVGQASMGFPDIGKAKSAVQRIFPVIDRRSAIDPASGEGTQALSVRGEIELRGVTFAYPARPSVLVFNNFSLTIPAGKTVALVGESGSGKSTIIGLIERFYDPLSGTVLFDGADIRSYNLGWLRRTIGLVSQEPLLFTGSIIDNIRYGSPNATLEQVEAAARAANAHDFISALPDGYNTQVGERGIQLSGGQKQRVAIARAVVKDPRVLLLDEATSALDAASEQVVQEALDRIMVGRTSVVVAHRLSTIRNADKIALVYRGAVLEEGTHDQLMALPNGGYARLVAAQERTKGGTGMSKSGSKADVSA